MAHKGSRRSTFAVMADDRINNFIYLKMAVLAFEASQSKLLWPLQTVEDQAGPGS